MNKFEEIYLKILNEESSPTTFTPEELLDDIRKRCFFSHGEIIYYTMDELKSFCDDKNKPLFSLLLKHMKYNDDYAILIVYFTSLKQIDSLMTEVGYMHPHMHHPFFSLNKVHKQFKEFFKITDKSGVNFNSIDVNPSLGCVIGINGSKINSARDFEKEFDHELNHYFEQLNIHYDFEKYPDNIIDINSKNILNKLQQFYNINFANKENYIKDLKTHLFDYKEFRSMSANVFHEVLKYNETHLKELEFHSFLTDISNCNYQKYKEISLQEMILFCWVCKQISGSRWNILIDGIKEAISIKKNIFQKFFIKSKDLIRNFMLKGNNK